MAHVAKYAKAALGHMFKHYERAKDENGDYIKFGNEEIDTSKSHLNYNLAPSREIKQGEFLKKRCSEIQCLNRKDVNVMCSWVVTAPEDLLEKEERDFFKYTYKFLEDRYGSKNVVSAYVHLDEVTPHMHFAFIPVVYDNKKNKEKVSAKERVSKSDLKSFHGDLDKHLEKILGHKIGILNEATRDGNRSIQELKRGTATLKLEGAVKKLEKLSKMHESVRDSVKILQVEKDALESQINEYQKLRGSVVPAKEKKRFFTGEVIEVTMSKKVYEACVSAQLNEEKNKIKLKYIEQELNRLKGSTNYKALQRLTKKVEELENKNRSLSMLNKQKSKEVNRVTKVFEKHPEVSKSFLEAERKDKAFEKAMNRERDFGMER